MKKWIFILALFLLSMTIVLAQDGHDAEIEEGKKLVESKISCDELKNEPLEAIGEYYMEQMHPGEAHELMDNMMGGEGSQSLKQVHINIAKRLYCNDNVYVGYGMMNSGSIISMMGGGMMGNSPLNYGSANSYGTIFWTVLLSIIICLMVWMIYRLSMRRNNVMNENKNVWIGILVVAVVLLLFSSLSIGGYGMIGFGMGFGLIFMLLFWGMVIWLIITLIDNTRSNNRGTNDEDALSMLKKRYASGKISKKQYESKKKELK